jgi:hypothetical protein
LGCVRLFILIHRVLWPGLGPEKRAGRRIALLANPTAVLFVRLSALPPPLPAEINTAFELLHSGKCLRCVLNFDK